MGGQDALTRITWNRNTAYRACVQSRAVRTFLTGSSAAARRAAHRRGTPALRAFGRSRTPPPVHTFRTPRNFQWVGLTARAAIVETGRLHMAVPSYEALMRPTLERLAEQGQQQFRVLVDLVADREGLTDEDRRTTIESGKSVLTNRVGWAVTYMVQAGVVRRPKRGFAEITDRGKKLLAEVSGPTLQCQPRPVPRVSRFRRRSRKHTEQPGDTDAPWMCLGYEGLQ